MKLLRLFLIVPLFAQAAPLPESDAAAYLESVAAARPRDTAIAVHFRETRTSPMLAKPSVSEGELMFQPPDRFRRETTDGNLLVSDGATLWIYAPAAKSAESYPLKSRAGDAFRGLMAAFDFRDVSRLFQFSVEAKGRQMRVTLVPKRRAERRLFREMTLDLGPDKKLQRAAWTTSDGAATELVFSNERAAGRARFDFQPPEGVTVRSPLGK